MLDARKKPAVKREVILEDFQVNREYPDDAFQINPPKGSRILDFEQMIRYDVGDSEEEIAMLSAVASTKKAFFEEMRNGVTPPLEGDSWLNSKPICLKDCLGKEVETLFWSMGCGACLQELKDAQRQWERRQQQGDHSHVFISIHPYVDDESLLQLKEKLRKEGFTFPVMIDSPPEEGCMTWGKTYAVYGVNSVPTTVRIDGEGRVIQHSSERGFVHARDHYWLKHFSEHAQK